MTDIFSSSITYNKNIVEATKKDLSSFKPNPKKGKDGVYHAVVRFIPNPDDPENKSTIAKRTVALEDPTQQGVIKYIDIQGTGDILSTTYWNLKKSSNPTLQANAKKLSSKLVYTSLVQVLSSDEPEMVGKILPWQYGMKVFDKIEEERNNEYVKRDPFDLLGGRPFIVNVKEVSGFPNYDSCKFETIENTDQYAMHITDKQGNTHVVNQAFVQQLPNASDIVINYIKSNMPDMSSYDVRPRTSEEEEFINKCLAIYTNPDATNAAAMANLGFAPSNNGGAIPTATSSPLNPIAPSQTLPPQSGDVIFNSQSTIEGLSDVLGGGSSQPTGGLKVDLNELSSSMF